MRLLSAITGCAGIALLAAACSSDPSTSPTSDGGTTNPDGSTTNPGSDAGGGDEAGLDGALPDDASGDTDGGADAGEDTGVDAGVDAGDDGGGVIDPPPGQPGILTIGRFDATDPNNLKFAWPGSAIIANFDGTSASVTLGHVGGPSGVGPTYYNVLVDDVMDHTFSVAVGANQTFVLASGLAAGTHKVEIQKRTEANIGVETFSGFTFSGGAGLLEPPPRQTKRIEWLTDSTMEGFGVDGNRNVVGQCTGNPPQYNNARESTAWFTSYGTNSEMMMLSYSGKGITQNEGGAGGTLYPALYTHTTPDQATAWNFANDIPDVVVLSIGGSDITINGNSSTITANFQSTYDTLVGNIRAHYPNAYIFATVWSQIKTYNGARQVMGGKLQAVVNARAGAGDDRIFYYAFPEANSDADETGCAFHANATHHQNMANLLIAQLQAHAGF